jgi:hypothetical protein
MSAKIMPGTFHVMHGRFEGVDRLMNGRTTIRHRNSQCRGRWGRHGYRRPDYLGLQAASQHSQSKNGKQANNGQNDSPHIPSSIKSFDYPVTAGKHFKGLTTFWQCGVSREMIWMWGPTLKVDERSAPRRFSRINCNFLVVPLLPAYLHLAQPSAARNSSIAACTLRIASALWPQKS